MRALVAALLAVVATMSGALVLTAGAVALLFDENDLKPFLSEQVRTATGRDLVIEGDLDIALGLTTTLRADGLRFANAEWAEPENMATIGALEVEMALWPLLDQRLVLPAIVVDTPQVTLIRDASGRANWSLGGHRQTGSEGPPVLPEIRNLEVTDARLTYRDAAQPQPQARSLDLELATLSAEAADGGRLALEGAGQLDGKDVALQGAIGALARLKDDEPYPVALDLEVLETSLQVDGTIDRPLSLRGFEIDFTLEDPEPASTLRAFDLPEQAVGPIDLAGTLVHRDQTFRLSGASGHIGDVEIDGSASIDLATEPPTLEADLDWNAFKPLIQSAASAALGRAIEISGDLEVDVGDITTIKAADLRLANPEWAESEDMVTIAGLELELDLWRAIDGTVRLPRIRLDTPEVALIRNADGQANWDFGPPPPAGGQQDDAAAAEPSSEPKEAPAEASGDAPERRALPEIDRLMIQGGRLVVQDAVLGVAFDGGLGTIEVEDDQGQVRDDVELSGQGQLADQRFALEVEAGGIVLLRDPDVPYPLKLDVRLGDTALLADGTLDQPLVFKGLDIDFEIEGPDPGPLLARFDLPSLSIPPYVLSGHLNREGGVWRLTEARGTIGDSDIAGEIAVDLEPEPLRITADLTSKQLDLDDVGGLIGLPPGTGEGETASEEQIAEAEAFAASEGVLPDASFDPGAWQNLDIEVEFAAESVQARNIPLEQVAVEARLERGLLAVDPAKANIGGGQLILYTTVDATRQPAVSDLDLRIKRLRLTPFLGEFEAADEAVGEVTGRVQLSGEGESVEAIAGTASGRVGITMSGGEVDALILEAVSLDLAEALAVMVGDDSDDPDDASSKIRCTVADFEVVNGVVKTKALVMDTKDMKITGAGTIDLEDESLDLVLAPEAKDTSLFAATTPIHIEGPLKNPSVAPEAGNLVARGAAAIGLGIALPVIGAVIPFIDLGVEDDSPCANLIAQAREAQTNE